MAARLLYKDYFNIDPEYYPVVTQKLIDEGKVDWRKFYPHETFVKLLETTYRVLNGGNKSIWVEGAYGTGKSHAALTIKSILTANSEDIANYFDEYHLSSDLRDKYITLTETEKILTIHRIGSSSIKDDSDLVIAVQESILAALKANHMTNQGEFSMKDAFLEWVSKPGNHKYLDDMITNDIDCSLVFKTGIKVDDIIDQLNQGSDEDVEILMRKVMKVMKLLGITSIIRDVNQMPAWIQSVIENNGLSAILFIWDEFSEYFKNHPVGLTGFQTLAEISLSRPFYFMIVAHESRNLFSDNATANKTLDRFEKPIKIELPENMAFRLMAQAMKLTDDALLKDAWATYKQALNDRLISVRKSIEEKTKKQHLLSQKTALSDIELQNVVPVHPYAALVLKNIAVLFNSNQRSMFDFIVSSDMTDTKGFKWYINNYGPNDKNYRFLTVDMLWNFFYSNELPGLNDDVRGILDNYAMLQGDKMDPEYQRVLKTILLLEAVSLRVSGNDLLIPDDENLELAFVGTWPKGKAIGAAQGLIEHGVLFKTPLGGGKEEYCVANQSGTSDIEKIRKDIIKNTRVRDLIVNAKMNEGINIPNPISNRFDVQFAGSDNFTAAVQNLNGNHNPNRFKVLFTFSLNDEDAGLLTQQILKRINMPDNDIIFIDSLVPMGKDLYDQYVNAMTFSQYNLGKNDIQSKHFEDQALSVLSTWRNRIVKEGAFNIYTPDTKSADRKQTLADVGSKLMDIDLKKYPFGLEQYPLNDTMYRPYQLLNGAKFGLTQKLSGAYHNNNKKKSIENALAGAWQVPKYWENAAMQSKPIGRIKLAVDKLVANGLETPEGMGIYALVKELEEPPFGFIPSSICSLVLGFALKEYTTIEYLWRDGTSSETMTIEHMANAIAGALNQIQNPSEKFRDQYIVKLSPEKRAFLDGTEQAFHIRKPGTVETARDLIRVKMKEWDFPIWCIKHALKDVQLLSSESLVKQVLDEYCNIANTANGSGESESMIAEKIGAIMIKNPLVVQDLGNLLKNDTCVKGMMAYLDQFDEGDGNLPELAGEIADSGKYLSIVKSKISASDANWVWNKSTVDDKVRDTILDYNIIKESNKFLGNFTTLSMVLDAWERKVDQIKMPYDVLENITGELAPFLKQLYYLKKSGLTQEHKREFYDLIKEQGANFDYFYKHQVEYFEKDAKSIIGDVDKDDLTNFYNNFPSGQFDKSSTEYYQFVQDQVSEYTKKQWSKKLHDLWRQKTASDSPDAWSDKYLTPILCMFDDEERPKAQKMLDVIRSKNPLDLDAQAAMNWLKDASFYDRLASQEERDKCFKERIIKSNSVLLPDVNVVRKELQIQVYYSCYDWMDNTAVTNRINLLADKEYKLSGKQKALELVDNMDAETLKQYLCKRISKDPKFGMQFLKGEN